MLRPILLESESLLIHHFRPEDMARRHEIISDIFSILSDESTLKFLPSKRLHRIEEAEAFLHANLLNYHSGRNYIHFITDKASSRVIGIIDLISPQVAAEYYLMDSYPYFIEFYLSGGSSGCQIMSEVLPSVSESVISQGIPVIGAVVNRLNMAATRVLQKANFQYKEKFDVHQDLYLTIT